MSIQSAFNKWKLCKVANQWTLEEIQHAEHVSIMFPHLMRRLNNICGGKYHRLIFNNPWLEEMRKSGIVAADVAIFHSISVLYLDVESRRIIKMARSFEC